VTARVDSSGLSRWPHPVFLYMSRVKVMIRIRRPSPQTIRVLLALAAQPSEWRYGYELSAEVDLKSGAVYPILMRLADRGLLESAWKPSSAGRPPRHVYRLTALGAATVAELAIKAVPTRPSVVRPQPGRA
jgi:PadR family transcriptional regulator PadR